LTELAQTIHDLVSRWLEGPDPLGLRPAVLVSGALPVYSDLGGTLFVRPDGEILFLEHDSPDEPKVERDPAWRLSALVSGAEKYPELRPLLPVRGKGARECDACAGRGRVQIGEAGRGILCGRCRGLGWLPRPA
jgi:hypothetical protein